MGCCQGKQKDDEKPQMEETGLEARNKSKSKSKSKVSLAPKKEEEVKAEEKQEINFEFQLEGPQDTYMPKEDEIRANNGDVNKSKKLRIETLIEHDPREPQHYLALGLHVLQQNKDKPLDNQAKEEATKSLKQALELNDFCFEAREALAIIAGKSGNIAEAEKIYREGEQLLGPAPSLTLSQLHFMASYSVFLTSQKRLEQAEKIYKRICMQIPKEIPTSELESQSKTQRDIEAYILGTYGLFLLNHKKQGPQAITHLQAANLRSPSPHWENGITLARKLDSSKL